MVKPTDTCTCPHCRARLQVKETFERKIRQKQYFTILTACGEYQVLRMFLLSVEMEKGCKAMPYVIEIGQYWWNAAPRIEKLKIDPDKIGAVIGKGGEVINKITSETGAEVDIKEDGLIKIGRAHV